MKLISRPELPSLPNSEALWCRIFDEILPTWVKLRYLPDARVAERPFGPADVRFFGRAVEELSDHFTSDQEDLGDYFSYPKFRSAYALYWIPLQAAKVWTLIHLLKPAEQERMFDTPELSVLDVGSGPGTASLAVLVAAAAQKKRPQKIVIHLMDQSKPALKDGVDLLKTAAEALDLEVQVKTYLSDLHRLKVGQLPKADFIVCANTLNELHSPTGIEALLDAATRARAGALWVEPASREPSQVISDLRGYALESKLFGVRSPCLHEATCPMLTGRDWCHWSVGGKLPGHWFHEFSKVLGSERHWLKFSHLWLGPLSAEVLELPVKKGVPPRWTRALTDPMEGSILLCAPEKPERILVQDRGSQTPRRGDLVER